MPIRFIKYQEKLKRSLYAFLFLFSLPLLSQNPPAYDILTPVANGYRMQARVLDGDTIPSVNLETVHIYTDYVFRTRRMYEQWTRTKYNVKKVYPYAILAAAKLKEYDRELEKIHGEKEKKAYIKVCEKDLRNEFEDELKALTVSQGKVLMKLIDREAGKTTYEVVKQMRGSFEAAMWQTLACIFGHNMKAEYDANVEDILIERAVKLVESGQF
jgi:hypothetical protein